MSKSFSFVLTLNILWFSLSACYTMKQSFTMRHIAQNTLSEINISQGDAFDVWWNI